MKAKAFSGIVGIMSMTQARVTLTLRRRSGREANLSIDDAVKRLTEASLLNPPFENAPENATLFMKKKLAARSRMLSGLCLDTYAKTAFARSGLPSIASRTDVS